MNSEILKTYENIRSGGAGFHNKKRGLIAVWGKEAVQFLDGLITNDMKTLEDGGQMLAAFPNAQGRLLAVVRVLRQDDKFLFETEDTTREKLFANLFRFTYAGDFFVDDLSDKYRYFEVFGSEPPAVAGVLSFVGNGSTGYFVPAQTAVEYRQDLINQEFLEISDNLHEVLRIENGTPKYGVDMDETTIVPELGLDGLISYNKGCYIGQEIIARIHFRGHVAKRLTGLIMSELPAENGCLSLIDANSDASDSLALKSLESKNAGRIKSLTFSPRLEKTIALGYVRYEYLGEGTNLLTSVGEAHVQTLPFVI